MNKMKLWAKISAGIFIFMFFNEVYIWFFRNGFTLSTLLNIWTLLYILLYFVAYGIIAVPLIYLGFRKE